MEEKIKIILKKYNININNTNINYFIIFFNELIEYNKHINLTSIVEENEVIVKHFLDSAFPHFLIEQNAKVLDIGAGAGFPSLPLKFVRDDLKITMLDSLNKRVIFLDHIIKLLNLKNTNAVHSRIEEYKQKEKFDYVVVRAVASLSTLIEYALPFLKVGGFFLAYKSSNVEQEINIENALKILGGKIEKVLNYDIEGNKRTIIVIKKIKACNNMFPRGKNLPKLKPL